MSSLSTKERKTKFNKLSNNLNINNRGNFREKLSNKKSKQLFVLIYLLEYYYLYQTVQILNQWILFF